MSIGARLAELRLRKGRSLQDVADVVGVSKTHVWQMEKGRSENPSIELLKRFAEYFSVPIEFLIGNESTSLEDIEAQQFFRDFKSLSDEEREILRQTLNIFKSKRVTEDDKA